MYGSVRSQLMQVYVQKSTRTTFPRSDAAVSGGELSQSFARSSDASPDWPAVGPVAIPCRNGSRIPVEVVGCGTLASPRKPAIGAPIAMASTAAIKSLLVFIDECPAGFGSTVPRDQARRRAYGRASYDQDQLRNGRWVEWSMCSAMVLRACSVTDQHVSPRTSRIVKLSLLCRRCLPYHRWRRRCLSSIEERRAMCLGSGGGVRPITSARKHTKRQSRACKYNRRPSVDATLTACRCRQQTPVKWHGSCKWRTT